MRIDALKAFGIFLILEGIFSIVYSTDQIPLFLAGRLLRIAIGALFLLGALPENLWKIAGIYIVLEAIGSMVFSPDQDELFQLGRLIRVAFGTMLYFKKQ
ncbi:MAG TPA: hypothetical protein VI875_05225 [Candidatus Norongarragalinales archaeon]|nr:hypothetical protein [Candidatus Norongarragalinales archaeon]